MHDHPFSQVSPGEVDHLWLMVQRFSLVFLLQEIIWTQVRLEEEEKDRKSAGDTPSLSAIPGFDVLQYGVQRYKQYHRNKYNILTL